MPVKPREFETCPGWEATPLKPPNDQVFQLRGPLPNFGFAGHAKCYNVAHEKTSVRELHIDTSKLVREAAEGGVIVNERRGEPVAELRPVIFPRRMVAAKKARIFASTQRVWDRMPRSNDSAKIIEDDRGR